MERRTALGFCFLCGVVYGLRFYGTSPASIPRMVHPDLDVLACLARFARNVNRPQFCEARGPRSGDRESGMMAHWVDRLDRQPQVSRREGQWLAVRHEKTQRGLDRDLAAGANPTAAVRCNELSYGFQMEPMAPNGPIAHAIRHINLPQSAQRPQTMPRLTQACPASCMQLPHVHSAPARTLHPAQSLLVDARGLMRLEIEWAMWIDRTALAHPAAVAPCRRRGVGRRRVLEWGWGRDELPQHRSTFITKGITGLDQQIRHSSLVGRKRVKSNYRTAGCAHIARVTPDAC